MHKVIALLFLAALLSLVPNAAWSQSSFKGCAAEGSAKHDWVQELNKLKNRDNAPTSVDSSVSLAEILNPGHDEDRFDKDQGVEVTGYVASVVPGGFEESCNCGRDDLQDIHINIVSGPQWKDTAPRYVIAEITPRWQDKLNVDFDSVKSEIEGKWVTFKGWLLFDQMHRYESAHTANLWHPTRPGQKHPKVWRATGWEVHPVTSYRVLHGPPH